MEKTNKLTLMKSKISKIIIVKFKYSSIPREKTKNLKLFFTFTKEKNASVDAA